MPKFLIDENLSPFLATYLRSLGYQARAIREVRLTGKSDQEILTFAIDHGYVIITRDIEFGELFYLHSGRFGAIILRDKAELHEDAIKMTNTLHKRGALSTKKLEYTLIVATAKKIRIRTKDFS